MSDAAATTTLDGHDGAPDLALEMWSQPRLLAAARALVSQTSQRLGFTETESGRISLAVDEALCNVINHGYGKRADGRIWLRIWAGESDGRPHLRLVLEDRARTVDPAEIQSRDLDDVRPGGLGVHIIREIMDTVEYAPRDGGGMRLTMTKTASAQPEAAGVDCPANR